MLACQNSKAWNSYSNAFMVDRASWRYCSKARPFFLVWTSVSLTHIPHPSSSNQRVIKLQNTCSGCSFHIASALPAAQGNAHRRRRVSASVSRQLNLASGCMRKQMMSVLTPYINHNITIICQFFFFWLNADVKLQLNNVASVFDYMSELAFFALLFVVAGLPDYAVSFLAGP